MHAPQTFKDLKVLLIFLFYDSTLCLWYFLQLKWYSITENASIVEILRYFKEHMTGTQFFVCKEIITQEI